MSDTLRCFVAVGIPHEIKERLGEAQARLIAAEPDWKWVEPVSFHVTLKFLGQVERDRLSVMWRSVRERLGGVRPFTIRLRGMGVFPNPRLPRVAWAGIDEGAAELAEVAARVEAACYQHGFEREKRPFQAHLTLGRARQPGARPGLGEVIGGLSEEQFGQFLVDRVLLMRSELTRDGARYHVLEEQVFERGETG